VRAHAESRSAQRGSAATQGTDSQQGGQEAQEEDEREHSINSISPGSTPPHEPRTGREDKHEALASESLEATPLPSRVA